MVSPPTEAATTGVPVAWASMATSPKLSLYDGTHTSVDAAYQAIATALGQPDPPVLVQPMAEPGLELVAGVVHDPVFGSVVMLGLGVRDATAGFRAYRAATLRTISLDQVESTGYCFQIDLTVRVANAGLRIVEVPITFVEREHGASKMSNSIILEAFWRVAQWGVARRLHRNR